jgi:hypothetical protein
VISSGLYLEKTLDCFSFLSMGNLTICLWCMSILQLIAKKFWYDEIFVLARLLRSSVPSTYRVRSSILSPCSILMSFLLRATLMIVLVNFGVPSLIAMWRKSDYKFLLSIIVTGIFLSDFKFGRNSTTRVVGSKLQTLHGTHS